MMHYTYCLIPSGDTAVTARLYTSISYGCIPVIISNINGAFSKSIDYKKFSIFVDVEKFINNPLVLEEVVKTSNVSILSENLKIYQKELLWYSNTTVENFLSEAYDMSLKKIFQVVLFFSNVYIKKSQRDHKETG